MQTILHLEFFSPRCSNSYQRSMIQIKMLASDGYQEIRRQWELGGYNVHIQQLELLFMLSTTGL